MKRTGYQIASGILAAVLVMTPAVPVLAAGTGSGQNTVTTTQQAHFSGAKIKAASANTPSAVQMLHGTVSPMVTSGKATRIGTTDPNRELQLDFVLKPRDKTKMTSLAAAGKKVSLAQYKARFAPTSTSLQIVQNFLKQSKLQVVNHSEDMIVVKGTVSQFETALHLKFNDYQDKKYKFYSNTTDPALPADVATALQGIVGLTQTPYHAVPLTKQMQKQAAGASNGSFTPDVVRTAYGMMPAYGNGIDGTGRNIAILMTGDFSDSDVKTFSQTFGLPYDARKITRKYVPNVSVLPPYKSDIESTLDVEWAHAFAPGANITEYEVGTLADTDLFAGLDTIMSSSPTVDVINMSFGGAEGYMSANLLDTWHTKFAEAVAKGITPVASSGDNGAYGYGDPTVGIQSPASDPFVLSIGGTSLAVDANNRRTDETGWGDAPLGQWAEGDTYGSGGGVSNVFTDLAGGSMQKRPVPDVAGLSQNLEMYQGTEGGWFPADGTSFAAPMWSGILALAAQKAKHGLGWINPGVDTIATDGNHPGVLRDITEGNNGVYSNQVGYDKVTGWGSPGNGWALVQALAAQTQYNIQSRLQIEGTVIGDYPYDYNDSIMNGVGTVDLLGSGFGDTQGQGFVTLSRNGVFYKVPVTNWTDTDITLKIDADGYGLFSDSVPHPSQPGMYQLAVHTTNLLVTNAVDVTLSDFLNVTDSSSTPSHNPTVVSGDTPVYQDVTITAYNPDGSGIDSTLPDTPLNFAVTTNWYGDTSGFHVQQNGQPCLQNPDGSFQVMLQKGGQTTVQVASDHPGMFVYDVEGDGMYGQDGSPVFTLADQSGTHLVNNMDADYNRAPTGQDNMIAVALEDAKGNIVSEQDNIQVTLTPDQNGQYPTGDVSINGGDSSDQPLTPPTGASPTYTTTLYGGGGANYLNVSDTVAESVTLTVTDLDNQAIPPLQIPLIFTKAHTVQLTSTSDPNGVSVSVKGQDPNWQELQLSVLDQDQNKTYYDGESYFQVNGSLDYLSAQPIAYQVEASYDQGQTWEPLQESDGQYPLDLSQAKLNDANDYTLWLRVASPDAEFVTFRGNLVFSTNVEEGELNTEFLAGAAGQLTAEPMLPHMATSSTKSPQYVPVWVDVTDANGNRVQTDGTDTIVLSESSQSPLYTVALAGKNGKMQVIRPVNGTWSFTLSQLSDHQVYIASARPGMGMFQLKDLTNTNVNAGTFTIDFVNSMVTTMKAQTPDSALAGGGTQMVEVDLLDANGQPVISSTDQVGLSIKKPKGNLMVQDANGNILLADSNQRYVLQADAGVAKFFVVDDTVENLSYTFTDLSETKVKSTTITGSFVLPSKFVMTPVAASDLTSDKKTTITVTATDAKGHALPGATVFLSFTPTDGGGTAEVVGDGENTPLDTTALPFVTGPDGQLTIQYTAPHLLPGGGTDTLLALDNADPKKAHVKSTDLIKFTPVAKFVWTGDGKSIAKPGTLAGGTPTTVKVTALDARNHALPHTIVYLSLNAKDAGVTAVVEGQGPALCMTPMPYATDANGQVTITYTPPQQLPVYETDQITVQNANSKYPSVKSTSTYTYRALSLARR